MDYYQQRAHHSRRGGLPAGQSGLVSAVTWALSSPYSWGEVRLRGRACSALADVFGPSPRTSPRRRGGGSGDIDVRTARVPPQALFGHSFWADNGRSTRCCAWPAVISCDERHQLHARRALHSGRFCACLLLISRIPYWGASLGPLSSGATGIHRRAPLLSGFIIRPSLWPSADVRSRVIIEFLFRREYGSSGLPYVSPGGRHPIWGSCPALVPPWVVAISLLRFALFRSSAPQLGSYLRAAPGPDLVAGFGINVPR